MRKIVLGLVALAVVAVAAFVMLMPKAASPASLEEATLRLKWLHQAQFAGFYAAAEEGGGYEKAGIKVRIEPGGPNFPAIQTVVSGGEQFGVAGADQILLARSQGVPVVPLMVVYRESPFVLFSRADAGIKGPADMRGRNIGVKLGGNEELIYRALIAAANVKPDELTEVPVQFDMAPFFAGAVDVWPGYAINEPLVAEEKGVPVQLVKPSDSGIRLFADVLFCKEELIRSNPKLVREFVEASTQGWKQVIADSDLGGRLSMKYATESNLDHQVRMMKASLPFIDPDGRGVGIMTRDGWSSTQDLLTRGGFLKQPVDLDAMLKLSVEGGAVVQ